METKVVYFVAIAYDVENILNSLMMRQTPENMQL